MNDIKINVINLHDYKIKYWNILVENIINAVNNSYLHDGNNINFSLPLIDTEDVKKQIEKQRKLGVKNGEYTIVPDGKVFAMGWKEKEVVNFILLPE